MHHFHKSQNANHYYKHEKNTLKKKQKSKQPAISMCRILMITAGNPSATP